MSLKEQQMAKFKAVTPRNTEDGGEVFDFRCPYRTGCGDNGVPFSSTGWANRDHAVARGKQHVEEHKTGVPMPPLEEFRAEHGLTAKSAGQAVLPDDWEF